jgi:glucose-1-phosphate thymidylyltransferase
VAYRMGYISAADMIAIGQTMAKNAYGQYLITIANEPF